eukprot:4817469-Lingulodinium_polyedra.AAC.1
MKGNARHSKTNKTQEQHHHQTQTAQNSWQKNSKLGQTKRNVTTQEPQRSKRWGPTLTLGGKGPNMCELLWRSVYFADT